MDINCQNFFYNDLSIMLAENIANSLQKSKKKDAGYLNWIYPCRILNDYSQVEWQYEVVRDDSDFIRQRGFDIWASAGANIFDEPSISMTIILPKNTWLKKNRINFANLVGVAAHEIHHLAQNIDDSYYEVDASKYLSKIKKPTNRIRYLLDPVEIGAFKVGFRAESMLSGRAEKSIILEYLDNFSLSKRSATIIANAWLEADFGVFNHNLMR